VGCSQDSAGFYLRHGITTELRSNLDYREARWVWTVGVLKLFTWIYADESSNRGGGTYAYPSSPWARSPGSPSTVSVTTAPTSYGLIRAPTSDPTFKRLRIKRRGRISSNDRVGLPPGAPAGRPASGNPQSGRCPYDSTHMCNLDTITRGHHASPNPLSIGA
jgi:hypothetical protein